jgi:hypothetical protein
MATIALGGRAIPPAQSQSCGGPRARLDHAMASWVACRYQVRHLNEHLVETTPARRHARPRQRPRHPRHTACTSHGVIAVAEQAGGFRDKPRLQDLGAGAGRAGGRAKR